MGISRRNFIKSMSGSFIAMNMSNMLNSNIVSRSEGKIAGIGMCDWNLGKMATPDTIPKAKDAHLHGIQVSLGTGPDNLPLREPEVRKKYLDMGKRYGITFHSVALGMLNSIPLATEPQSAIFVIDAIDAAKALGAKNVLLAFFGRGDLRLKNSSGKLRDLKDGEFSSYELDSKAVKRVVEALRLIVPRAEDAGIALGIENTITAKQNLEIIDQIGSPIAQVYYDVGNSTGEGYDAPGEIRMLRNDRICEVHLKDWKTPILGSPEAQVDMKACAKALDDIGYDKWLVLETSGRKDKFIEDTRANVAYVKKTFNVG